LFFFSSSFLFPMAMFPLISPELIADATISRLCRTRSPSREALWRQRAGRLGSRHPLIHHRLQGEPFL
jgi:hypothetical protein